MLTSRRLSMLLLLLIGSAASADRIRALVLSGANNHDWATTTPALVEILELSGRFSADVTEDPAALTAASLDEYDLIISNWTNWPSQERVWGDEAETAILDFVRDGKGYVVFHAACAVFTEWPEYQQLIGATWGHGETGHGAIHGFEVTIPARKHAITRGLPDFRTRDELWHKTALHPDSRVLATAFSAETNGGTNQDEPVALVTKLGDGRGFNLILGHDVAAMDADGWKMLMLRGAEWAATGRATIERPVDIDLGLAAVAEYERHGSRARLIPLERLVQQAATDATLRKTLVPEMVDYLASDATTDAKAFILSQLSLIAGPRQVPAIAAFVSDGDLGPHAVAALERIPGKAAAAALPPPPERDDALVADQLMALAEEHKREGHRGVKGVYEILLSEAVSDVVVEAAVVGWLSCLTEDRIYRTTQALKSDDPSRPTDPAWVAGGLRYLRDSGDSETARAVASDLSQYPVPIQARLVQVLADIGAVGAEDAVIEALSHGDPGIRRASIQALGAIGRSHSLTALSAALEAGPPDDERPEIETALAAVVARMVKDGEIVIAPTFAAAGDPATQASLLRVLSAVGGDDALAAMLAALGDASAETRLATIDALAHWPNAAPMPSLLELARLTDDARARSAALGAIAALTPRAMGDSDGTVALLAGALEVAPTVDDRNFLHSALGVVPSPAAMDLAVSELGDETVFPSAAHAAIRIAETLGADHLAEIQPAMEAVLALSADHPGIATRAKTVLRNLGVPIDVTESETLADTGPNLALEATATSPDGIDKDGASHGDQAAIDGDAATYWDEVDNQSVYRLTVTFAEAREVSALRITAWAHHSFAPKDFEIICDGVVVKTVADAWYEGTQFAVTFPPATCTTLELNITGRHGPSPAIRELEIFNPGR